MKEESFFSSALPLSWSSCACSSTLLLLLLVSSLILHTPLRPFHPSHYPSPSSSSSLAFFFFSSVLSFSLSSYSCPFLPSPTPPCLFSYSLYPPSPLSSFSLFSSFLFFDFLFLLLLIRLSSSVSYSLCLLTILPPPPLHPLLVHLIHSCLASFTIACCQNVYQ